MNTSIKQAFIQQLVKQALSPRALRIIARDAMQELPHIACIHDEDPIEYDSKREAKLDAREALDIIIEDSAFEIASDLADALQIKIEREIVKQAKKLFNITTKEVK